MDKGRDFITRIWAVVPGRSGSKGLPGKNIRQLSGVPLIAHAIRFAQATNIFEKIFLSTDSEEYSKVGIDYGAWVPFLRGAQASQDQSMEEDVLADIDLGLKREGITPPDVLVWLRPTFPFRSVTDLISGVELLDDQTDSVRLVLEGEPRLYEMREGFLKPRFADQGRSMIRRQEFPPTYRVFHTDIFWYRNISLGQKFLGDKVRALKIHKICGLDIDDIDDFEMAEALVSSNSSLIRNYTHHLR